jgi:hypothetical protein
VCTISTEFYYSYLTKTPIEPLEDILKVQCTDDETMPYLGYINVNIYTMDIDTANSNECVMLLVPTPEYSQKVPAIISTNFIHAMMNCVHEQKEPRFIQRTRMNTPWYLVFRCLTLRKKNLFGTNIG